MVEQLDSRRLLAASIVGETLSINGSGAADTILLTLNRTDPTLDKLVVSIQPEGFNQTFAFDGSFKRIEIDAGGGNDLVTVNVADLYGIAIDGGAGNDTISAGPGNDVINGGAGNDSINGNEGNDIIDGGTGADVMHGDEGTDTVTYASRTADVSVTIDDLVGDGEAGEGDNVTLTIDTVIGGDGNDMISVDNFAGSRYFVGAAGDDTLIGGFGDDRLLGGIGNDLLDGQAGNDALIGASGADTFIGGEGRDRVDYYYEKRNVNISLDGVANDGVGKSERDNVGADVENLYGGQGHDVITGSGERNFIRAGAGDDTIYGNGNHDTIYGEAGDDSIRGGPGRDQIFAGPGNDTMIGNQHDDTLDGGGGTDTVIADAADLVLNVP